MGRLRIGCIADDFTGASDAASYLQLGGLPTLLVSGIPDAPLPEGAQAVVLALKTRTIAPEEAVARCEAAARWLLAQGAELLYFKYCSTFDSTPRGNIGPVTDRLLELTGSRCTVICPSLPDNGRVVRDGLLYVNGVPLSQSPMRDHPLTPMRDSDLTRLMGAQSRYPCLRFGRGDSLEGMLRRQSGRFTLVPDFETDADADQIAAVFGHLPLLTGGSGLLRALARRAAEGEAENNVMEALPPSRLAVISGSCSAMTQRQVAAWLASGRRAVRIDPEALLSGAQDAAALARELDCGGDILFYSTADAQSVRHAQRFGRERISALLEDCMARLACMAVDCGVQRLMIAGGETASAALQRLGYGFLEVGESLAPGVPVLRPLEARNLRLVLKSGNFGGEDFFLAGIP